MTEYEKMISEMAYDGADAFLVKERIRARQAMLVINNSDPEDLTDRKQGFERLFGRKDLQFWIEPPFYCDYGINIEVGENSYFNFGCVILDCAKVIIGKNCMFAPNVQIYTATHPLEYAKRNSGIEHAKKVVIKDNVWVGGNAIICPGVTIHEGAVIGAGSVVTHDVEANTVVVGNPAQFLKRIKQ